MLPKSNTLFHFTKSREVLKQVLKHGFWPRYCLEDVSWLGYPDHAFVAYPMVCFCEIPLSRISEHVGFYGQFGLGLTRQWAETNGLNPVMYVAGDNAVTNAFRESSSHAHELPDDGRREAAKRTARYLMAHTKPTSGQTLIDGEPVEKVFYQESEWRYVPRSDDLLHEYLIRSKFQDDDTVEQANASTRQHALLRFNPRDIRYIFVKADSDIPDIVNYIMSELDQFTGFDQKILTSRVLSLEALHDDL